jgi:DNA-directed RNA polymerase specialized sigma24 family protein
VLEIPENTVKTHLSRARATLREAWLELEGPR